ncbi:hypothetical protein ACMDCR_09405 [Labrys okinawensis]
MIIAGTTFAQSRKPDASDTFGFKQVLTCKPRKLAVVTFKMEQFPWR